MTERRFTVGEKVLASRAESGEDHEEATVRDVYELLIAGGKRPMVVVDFDDGERKWLSAAEPNVRPIEPGEPDTGQPDGGRPSESVQSAGAADET